MGLNFEAWREGLSSFSTRDPGQSHKVLAGVFVWLVLSIRWYSSKQLQYSVPKSGYPNAFYRNGQRKPGRWPNI